LVLGWRTEGIDWCQTWDGWRSELEGVGVRLGGVKESKGLGGVKVGGANLKESEGLGGAKVGGAKASWSKKIL